MTLSFLLAALARALAIMCYAEFAIYLIYGRRHARVGQVPPR